MPRAKTTTSPVSTVIGATPPRSTRIAPAWRHGTASALPPGNSREASISGGEDSIAQGCVNSAQKWMAGQAHHPQNLGKNVTTPPGDALARDGAVDLASRQRE